MHPSKANMDHDPNQNLPRKFEKFEVTENAQLHSWPIKLIENDPYWP